MTSRHAPARPTLALAGATVVVTRPTAAAASLKRRITELGGRALGLPGTSLRGADDVDAAKSALRAARTADFVIFASPNAVRHAFALLPDLRFARTCRVCAVGAGTTRALLRRGLGDVRWPRERQDSEGLLALPEFAALRGRRVVIIDAPQGRELLPGELLRRGAAQVSRIHVYRRTAPRFDSRHFDALAAAAAPLFVQMSSAESIAHLRERLPPALFAKLAAADAVVSSARIADTARAAGWRRIHLAASAGTADMLDAVKRAFARRRARARR